PDALRELGRHGQRTAARLSHVAGHGERSRVGRGRPERHAPTHPSMHARQSRRGADRPTAFRASPAASPSPTGRTCPPGVACAGSAAKAGPGVSHSPGRGVHMRRIVAGLLLTGLLAGALAAPAQVTTDEGASILLFPRVVVGPEMDTRIQIAN